MVTSPPGRWWSCQTMSSISRTWDTSKVRAIKSGTEMIIGTDGPLEFFRHLGLFENAAATYITMNFVSGLSSRCRILTNRHLADQTGTQAYRFCLASPWKQAGQRLLLRIGP